MVSARTNARSARSAWWNSILTSLASPARLASARCFPGAVVVVLHRRRLHEVARRRQQRAADAAVEAETGAANGVDDHARGVGRVPHLELQLDVQGHVTKVASLEPDVGPLAVLQPGHV